LRLREGRASGRLRAGRATRGKAASALPPLTDPPKGGLLFKACRAPGRVFPGPATQCGRRIYPTAAPLSTSKTI